MKRLSPSIKVKESKIFTYPTRLVTFLQPEIMTHHLPAYQCDSKEIELTVHHGSTADIGVKMGGRLYKKIYRKLAPELKIDEEYIHDTRYEVDGNMAHVLTHILPKLLITRDVYPKTTVILGQSIGDRRPSIGKQIYESMGFSVICTNKKVYGKHILINVLSNGNNLNGFQSCLGLYEDIFNKLDIQGYTSETPDRVFISRKKTRNLINEHEVEHTLKQYKFKKFYFEDLSISEQLSIARNAKVVVGLHGAAISTLIFNRNQVKVIELFNPGFIPQSFRKMINAVGGTWCGVTGQMSDSVFKDLNLKPFQARKYSLSPTIIDTSSLRMALEYLNVD
ncbi:glycosyltransferase family 61 protein [Coleofasciculus sp.]|uniref:glycosyltransferase family 61 protein n=1 Tax=Coleofasciculus sp. TaxID=3100458 RepID=UPI0039F95B3F